MYTPDGYLKDPPDAKCPYCGKSDKSCSYVNSVSRAWARDACKKKNDKQNPTLLWKRPRHHSLWRVSLHLYYSQGNPKYFNKQIVLNNLPIEK